MNENFRKYDIVGINFNFDFNSNSNSKMTFCANI